MSNEYKLIPATDTRLNGLSRRVLGGEIGGKYIQNIVKAMAKIAMGERDADHPNEPTLVGLAAPQLGEFVRIVLFDKIAGSGKPNFEPELVFIINPEITKASGEEDLGREGCYSTGDICAVIPRAKQITIRGLSTDGKKVEYELEDFQARIVQHEVDHLNGMRCPDRVRDPSRLHIVKKADFQKYRENWQNWQELCSSEYWLKVKSGGILFE